MEEEEWDWIVVGSGFGGSVCALRLVEKGYRVLMIEKGGRWAEEDFPSSNWRLQRWLWLPQLGLRGFLQLTLLSRLTALSGVGVGGGSLTYANTLATPREDFFSSQSWGHLANWEQELRPHYATASRMLGATNTPFVSRADEVLGEVAREVGLEDVAIAPSCVGVYFGEPGVTVSDPYFGGEGPPRTGCNKCGRCMVGCQNGAKNTLDRNYLWLAERRGLVILCDTEVTSVRPCEGGYEVGAMEGTSCLTARLLQRRFRARRVILAAGALGTVPLLLKQRENPDCLPHLSSLLGHSVRTNSEVLLPIVSSRRDVDFSEGQSSIPMNILTWRRQQRAVTSFIVAVEGYSPSHCHVALVDGARLGPLLHDFALHAYGGLSSEVSARAVNLHAVQAELNNIGLYVVDGSAISANPGVNPSLTIMALAERAMSFISRKDADLT